MAEKKPEEETPNNQSPETEEPEGFDPAKIDALVQEKVDAAIKAKAAEAPAPTGEGGTTGTETGGGDPAKPTSGGETSPAPPSPPVASAPTDVKAAVAEVLQDKEHLEQHAKLDAATAPKPKRKRGWVSRVMLGDRADG